MFSTPFDPTDRERIEAHIASGQPRYSILLTLAGGGYVRRWTNDPDAAVSAHAAAMAQPAMASVITFDHLGQDTVAVAFAARDADIDTTIERRRLEARP